ncbi:MAG: tRNA (guanosine(46)-N7)-methyltransferase TrmB [Pseudomonadota bacterium]
MADEAGPQSEAPGYDPRLYGRQRNKNVKPRQIALLDAALAKWAAPDPAAGTVVPADIAPEAAEVWLEIGFGGGEHLASVAAARPDVLMLGAETFMNGVARFLAHIEDEGLQNIRIHYGDARPLLEALTPASIDRLYVLHPDPWPKRRHWKRRLLSRWFLDAAARVLKPGGVLRVASDIPSYVEWTLMHALARPDFRWTARRAADWRTRPVDQPTTRYGAKSEREGRVAAYLAFERL